MCCPVKVFHTSGDGGRGVWNNSRAKTKRIKLREKACSIALKGQTYNEFLFLMNSLIF
jgi:hypothetical protein